MVGLPTTPSSSSSFARPDFRRPTAPSAAAFGFVFGVFEGVPVPVAAAANAPPNPVFDSAIGVGLFAAVLF